MCNVFEVGLMRFVGYFVDDRGLLVALPYFYFRIESFFHVFGKMSGLDEFYTKSF